MPVELKELLHNLKYRDWEEHPIYDVDENQGKKIIKAIEDTNKEIDSLKKLVDDNGVI